MQKQYYENFVKFNISHLKFNSQRQYAFYQKYQIFYRFQNQRQFYQKYQTFYQSQNQQQFYQSKNAFSRNSQHRNNR